MDRDEAREVLRRAFSASGELPPELAALLVDLTEQRLAPPPPPRRRWRR